MSSNALEAQGMTIAIDAYGSPATYTTIDEVKSFNGPNGSAAVIDVTDLSSTAKEKRMGLQDNGQLQMTLNWIPSDTQHAELMAAKADRQTRSFRITFTDASPATTWTFSAYVTSISIQGSVDGVVEANVTLEITGDITEA